MGPDEAGVSAPSPESLIYPFGDQAPGLDETIEVAPGIHWLRLPLPFSLDHINVWLIEDGDALAVVDTGVRDQTARTHWETIIDNVGSGRPVTRCFVTHYHPDHVGNAGWFVREKGARLCMSRTEYLLCKMLMLDKWERPPDEAVDFVIRAGYPEKAREAFVNFKSRGFGAMASRLPLSFYRLIDGETLTIGGREWEIVTGSGHSPEHACLYNKTDGILFSGDQVLPKITSNVSVNMSEPDSDPLSDWLASHEKLKQRISDDVLVLPAHNEPFRGLHARLDGLISRHEEGLSALYDLCAEPKKVVEVFPALFKREIGEDNLQLAVGESLAHLNCLIGRGKLRRTLGDDGAFYYSQA